MKSTRFQQRWLFLIAVLALWVAACTGAAEDPATTDEGDEAAPTTATDDGDAQVDDREDIELLFTIWAQSDPVFDAWGGIADAFVEQDPRVSSVSFEFVPFQRYHDVLNVRLASGAVQDGGWLATYLVQAYIDAGALYDMTDLFQDTPGWNLEEISDATLAGWSSDGRIYGYPFPQSPWQIFWNKDMFEEAGIPTPDEHMANGTWTWDVLVESGRAIQEAGLATWGFEWQQERPHDPEFGWAILDPIWSPFEAAPFSEDGLQCQFDSPEFVEAMQFWHDMVYEHGVYPPPGSGDPSIWAGEAPLGIYHIEAATAQAEGVAFEYGMAPQPAGDGGWPDAWRPAVATNGIVVFAGSPNADVAAEFLAFLTHPDHAPTIARLHSSPRPSALSPDLWTGRLEITEEEASRVIDAVEAGYRFGGHPNWGPVLRESQAVFDREFWNPDAEVGSVMATMCEAVQDLLG